MNWADLGIEVPSSRSVGNIKVKCPKCGPTSRHPGKTDLSIDLDQGLYRCHNNGCDFQGSLKSRERKPTHIRQDPDYHRKAFVRPDEEKFEKALGYLPPVAMEFLAKRGISEETAKHFNLGWADRAFKNDTTGEWGGALLFPYYRGGELINVKKRSLDKRFMLVGGAELIYYNLDAITDSDSVYIVEGELDALAMHEAGITNVISVPNGAPDPDKTQEAKLDYFDACANELRDKQHFVLAGDNDRPGAFLTSEHVHRLGKEFCSRVPWPEGCKDANDVLLKYGPDALRASLRAAKPYPVQGIARPKTDLRMALDSWRKTGMPSGVSTGWENLDELWRPVEGELTIVTGIPSHGKALDLQTPIATTTGWTTMGDIKVGDQVFDETGQPCTVVGVTEVWENRPCYRMVFSDGTEIIADAEHEWLTQDYRAMLSARNARKNGRASRSELQPRGTDQTHLRRYPAIRTTAEIAGSVTASDGMRANHRVAVAQALRLPVSELPLDPYVLGAWLGDGTSSAGDITTADNEILDELHRRGFETTGRLARYHYGIVGLKPILRQIGVFNNKHVPDSYLRASEHQRRDLLAGLLDTDGSVTPYGRVEFCNTNKKLADAVFELAASLGFQPTWCIDRARLNGRDCGARYRVMFTPYGSVFSLTRKQRFIKQEPSRRLMHRSIVSCEPVDSVPVRCIQVDSPSHLYLCDRAMIPTHNSSWVDALLINLYQLHGWRSVIFSPENYPTESHAAKLLEILSGKSFDEYSAARWLREGYKNFDILADDEYEFFLDILEDATSYIVTTSDDGEGLTLEEILDLARGEIYRRGTKILVLDPWNEIEHQLDKGMSETLYISAALSKIRRFARLTGVHVFLVAHPTKLSSRDEKYTDENGIEQVRHIYPVPDLYHVSGSSAWKSKADNGVSIWRDEFAEAHGGNPNLNRIVITKVKRKWVGKKGERDLEFSPPNGRFSVPNDRRTITPAPKAPEGQDDEWVELDL